MHVFKKRIENLNGQLFNTKTSFLVKFSMEKELFQALDAGNIDQIKQILQSDGMIVKCRGIGIQNQIILFIVNCFIIFLFSFIDGI